MPGADEEKDDVHDEDVVVIGAEQPAGHPAPGSHHASSEQDGSSAGRWSEIQAMFVDDPGASVREAARLVDQAVDGLIASLRKRQDAVAASWQTGKLTGRAGEPARTATGTEELRQALRAYRDMGDQLNRVTRQFAGLDRPGHRA